MTTSKPYSQPGEKGTDTNQASEDEVIKLLENYGLALATDGKLGTNKQDTAAAVLALIRTEKLKLLAAVRERVVERYEDEGDADFITEAQYEQLTKLEAEL